MSIKYPPKNRILVSIHINTILEYSAKKKNTNITAACSVINPLTNSDSASAKSKGALFVSATEPIKNMIKIANNGKPNHVIFWNCMFILRFKLFVIKITINNTELNTNS